VSPVPRKPGGSPSGRVQLQAREDRRQAELCRQEAAKLERRATAEKGTEQTETLAKASELRRAADLWNAEATKSEMGTPARILTT
jgi:hypothetical protein